MKYSIFVVKKGLFYFYWNIPFFSCNRFFLLLLEYVIIQFLPTTRFISVCWNIEYLFHILSSTGFFFKFFEYGTFQEYLKNSKRWEIIEILEYVISQKYTKITKRCHGGVKFNHDKHVQKINRR